MKATSVRETCHKTTWDKFKNIIVSHELDKYKVSSFVRRENLKILSDHEPKIFVVEVMQFNTLLSF